MYDYDQLRPMGFEKMLEKNGRTVKETQKRHAAKISLFSDFT
jgi:hypothetical protein